jgi:transcription termination factor NusB
MVDQIKRNFAPQLVGLGGTGADVIASLMRNKKLVLPLLNTDGVRLSCLALDVANAQIDNLQSAYEELKTELRLRNIPVEKIFLAAKSVKFPTPEVMFDFVHDYPTYMAREGTTAPADYKPWLSSVIEIPPLAGGVGRKRALAKAIYGLNYHVLRLISDGITSFKEHVVSSTVQPIVFVIYGMGGGSGSGLAVDFVRHLRRSLGSGIPIIGITVLPCQGDDPPAKGVSAYASLLESGLLADKGANFEVAKKFGTAFENPFNGFFVMPLSPAYGQGKGLLYAQKIIDEAVTDILLKCLNFDPADLLAHIGTNVDLEGKWVHTLSTISISYPVQEQIDLTKVYLSRLDKMRELKKEKKEICGGSNITGIGGVRRLLDACRSELADIYRGWLIAHERYDMTKFSETVHNLVYEDRSVDTDFIVYLKSVNESIRSHLDELYLSVRAIGLDAPEGTLEARIRKFLIEFYDLAVEVSQKPEAFESRVPEILSSLPEDLLTAQQLAPRQVQLVWDVMDFATLILDYMAALRNYLEIRKLADRLIRLLETSEKTEIREKAIARIRKISSPELVVLFSFVSSMLCPLTTELKNMDEYLTNCRRMKRLLTDEERAVENGRNAIEEQNISAIAEKQRVERDLQRTRPLFTSAGKKRFLEKKLNEADQCIQMLADDSERTQSELERVKGKIREYASIEKKFQTNSEYRRLVAEAIELTNRYHDQQTELVKDRGFYDRTGELTEHERLKIMQRILKGDETALSHENILKEILDWDHLRRYLVSVVNMFRLPDTLGLTGDYRSDFLWFTAVAPPGIWNKDLEQDVTTALSGYVREDVSRTIYVRQVESDDPWKVRFLLIAAKATPKQLSPYRDMRQSYDAATPGERMMAHSFLLEYGVQLNDDDPAILPVELNILRPAEKSQQYSVSKTTR